MNRCCVLFEREFLILGVASIQLEAVTGLDGTAISSRTKYVTCLLAPRAPDLAAYACI